MPNKSKTACDGLNIYQIDHLALQLGIAKEEICAIVSDIGSHYHKEEKPIYKDGVLKKHRDIYHPSNRLKRIIMAVDRKLLKKLPLPAFMHGSVKGRSHISNAKVHRGQPFICNLDIKNFFPSITPNHVYNLFRYRLKCSNEISKILVRLCTADRHVPQGYNTSSSIANLVLIPAAEQVKGLCDKMGFRLTIQVDDITISGYKNPEPYFDNFEKILNECGFTTNPDKRKCQRNSQRQEVTGVIVNRKLNLPKNEYSNLRGMIHICCRYGPYALLSRQEIKDKNGTTISKAHRLRAYLTGKLNYLKQVNPQKALRLKKEFGTIAWPSQ